jgi:uncharacterized protein YjbJ (UPF0337 family)
MRPPPGGHTVDVDEGTRQEEDTMGLDDKISNAAEKVTGKAKEAAGRASDDERLEAEGRGDQSKADLKDAGEKVKDAFKH